MMDCSITTALSLPPVPRAVIRYQEMVCELEGVPGSKLPPVLVVVLVDVDEGNSSII